MMSIMPRMGGVYVVFDEEACVTAAIYEVMAFYEKSLQDLFACYEGNGQK